MSYYELRRNKKRSASLFGDIVNKIVHAFVDTEQERLELKLKYVDILRGEAFVNDLRDTYIDVYPEANKFELIDLITLLYVDFVNQIKNGTYSHQDAATFLVNGKRKYLDSIKKPRLTRKKVQQVSLYSYILEDIEEEETEDDLDQEISAGDVVYLEIVFNTRENNRCKVFLYDIEPYLEGESLNVQDIIAIRYLNFIEQVRLEGNNSKVMKAILKNFINGNF